jgi:hypothetical protein
MEHHFHHDSHLQLESEYLSFYKFLRLHGVIRTLPEPKIRTIFSTQQFKLCFLSFLKNPEVQVDELLRARRFLIRNELGLETSSSEFSLLEDVISIGVSRGFTEFQVEETETFRPRERRDRYYPEDSPGNDPGPNPVDVRTEFISDGTERCQQTPRSSEDASRFRDMGSTTTHVNDGDPTRDRSRDERPTEYSSVWLWSDNPQMDDRQGDNFPRKSFMDRSGSPHMDEARHERCIEIFREWYDQLTKTEGRANPNEYFRSKGETLDRDALDSAIHQAQLHFDADLSPLLLETIFRDRNQVFGNIATRLQIIREQVDRTEVTYFRDKCANEVLSAYMGGGKFLGCPRTHRILTARAYGIEFMALYTLSVYHGLESIPIKVRHDFDDYDITNW